MEAIVFLLVAAIFFWLVILPIVVFIKLSSIQSEMESQKTILQKILNAKSVEKPTESSKENQIVTEKKHVNKTEPITFPDTSVLSSPNPSNRSVAISDQIPVSSLSPEISPLPDKRSEETRLNSSHKTESRMPSSA